MNVRKKMKDKTLKKKKIGVLVYNSCKFDNRVIKSSEALAKFSNNVIVFALSDPSYAGIERLNGVLYIREGIRRNFFNSNEEIILEVKLLRVVIQLKKLVATF